MSKYSSGAKKTIEQTMDKYGRGQLKSGKSGKKVTSHRQAVAIGISEARKKGYTVPNEQ